MSKQTVFVNQFTDGILDPNKEMLGPVKDGGTIVANTAPGCWGPMITPSIKGGHEVTTPVSVENAKVGDAIVVYIKSINVTSDVTASGNDKPIDDNYIGDPFVAAKCPHCDTINPRTKLVGVGPKSVKCLECGEEISPFQFTHGYTIAFNEKRELGVTLSKEAAYKAAENVKESMALPDNSKQNPIVNFAPHDLVGSISRMRPFIGQLGTTPSKPFPDSHNAGDFGAFLVDAPHEYALSEEELEKHRTDGHMDISKVREGSVLICPVKVDGGGIYVGDAHAMQGDGEIAGHTTDVSAVIELKVKVIKGLSLEGPLLLPLEEDLPHLAKPIREDELKSAKELANKWKVKDLEETAPISFIGTGADLNQAIDNGLSRAAKLFDMTMAEVKNRATITGTIEIGRAPGVVTVTFLAPKYKLEELNLYQVMKDHYKLY
ncbi:MAG: acetamidase/formamidase family protein [Clostridia bacterium]